MNEHRAKFAKQADKDSLTKIKGIIAVGTSPAANIGREILNRLTQMITAKENA